MLGVNPGSRRTGPKSSPTASFVTIASKLRTARPKGEDTVRRSDRIRKSASRRAGVQLAFQLFHGWNARRAVLLDRLHQHYRLVSDVVYGMHEAVKPFAQLWDSLDAKKTGRAPRWASHQEWSAWAQEMKDRGRLEMERTQRRIEFVRALTNPHPNPNRNVPGEK